MHFSCSHGVVYYVNFLLWSESARDHVDGLLSLKAFPTCFISDVSGQVARHMNNRSQQLFFQPNGGRLCPTTKENLALAAEEKLKIQMPWVQNLNNPPNPLQPPSVNGNPWILPHPITRTTERFALYDRFHQKNQKRPEESLRSLNLCPDLRSKINSSVAEQLNRELAAIRYSLPQMNEVHFKHTTRILLELHNRNINGKFLEDMTRQSSIPLTVGRMGTLVCMSSGWFTFFRDKSVLNTWMCNVRS